MENKELKLIAAKAFPGLSSESLTYNAEKNVFLTNGWTSASGNTYFRAIRGTKGLAVFFDLGQGWCHTFLNGISLYGFDGETPRLIAKRQWGGCNWRVFGENSAKSTCIEMLSEFFRSEAKKLGQYVSIEDANEYATKLIEMTHHKQIA